MTVVCYGLLHMCTVFVKASVSCKVAAMPGGLPLHVHTCVSYIVVSHCGGFWRRFSGSGDNN